MLKKGRKREAKGLAVLYFIIGLIILLIILAVIYFALAKLDYSDRIKNPDASMRAYVQATQAPLSALPAVEAEPAATDEQPEEVDLTVTATPTAEPTPTPTAEPTPTPTPEPTPEPTVIAPELISKSRTSGFKVPDEASANGVVGITECYVSQPDGGKIMYLSGYGYVDEETFDGTKAQSFLVISPVQSEEASKKMIAYQLTMKADASGMDHESAVCQNPNACDWEGYIDVSQYSGDIYSLALVIGYETEGSGKTAYAYYPFGSDVNFTVLDGQVVTPVTPIEAE